MNRNERPHIVLSTLNARWIHSAFGLRYLKANLGDLREHTTIYEATINQEPATIVEGLLARTPDIVGLGVYIWNVEQTTRVVALLKAVAPDVVVVLGGPEVSYDTGDLDIVQMADHVVQGEADHTFRALVERLFAGQQAPHTIPSPPADMSVTALPYDLYDDEDIAHRVLYVEASRGCPYRCEFCLSSLPIPVRRPDLDEFLEAMASLLARGARQFKFVDRTFNLDLDVADRILDFFAAQRLDDLFLHFEMVPDRLPDKLRPRIASFPPGALQFEVGVQTFNPEVARRIGRPLKDKKLEANLRWLAEETGVHIHADLIAGLPGEDLASFAAGFDRLLDLGPHEIQLGILKKLRGTPIARHDAEFGMVYDPHPPYALRQNQLIDFAAMQRVTRAARIWDRLANRGHLPRTVALLFSAADRSAFWELMALSDWMWSETASTSHSLKRLVELVYLWLTGVRGYDAERAARVLLSDYLTTRRRGVPHELRAWAHLRDELSHEPATTVSHLPRRQQSHHAPVAQNLTE